MTSSWLMSLVALAKGRIRRSQKTITYTYTVDTNRKPKRISSRSRLNCSSSSAGTVSSRESSNRSDSSQLSNKLCPGFVTAYVGSQRKRFIISSGILKHPLFKLVLDKSEIIAHPNYSPDVYDDETDAIQLSCEAEFLHRLLFLIDSGGDANQEMRWEELKKSLESGKAKLTQ